MVKSSVLLTVYDREYEVILACLRGLSRSLDEDSEVIVVNDGSSMNYAGVKAYGTKMLPNFRWIEMPEYDAFRIEPGFNNPAKAFNAALEAASGDRVYVMSSDVLVSKPVIERSMRYDFEEMAWTPLVVDTDSGMQYCGPLRLFPAPWFLGCSRKHLIACGGWDETYLQGMCYEDNDFIGRIMLQTKRFIGDWSVAVYHMSHDQPAYAVSDPAIAEANRVNREYTKAKWAGIPFGGSEDACFDVLRKPYVTGDIVHECRYFGSLLQDVIAKTRSPFVCPTPATTPA